MAENRVAAKHCTRCSEYKPLSEYGPRSRARDGHQAACRACEAARNMAGVNSFRDWLWALKSEPCTDCGLAWPPYVMQFDHLPGFQKEFGVTVRAWGKGRAKVLEEIAKCELVCANCHFIRTHQRLQG